MKEEEYVMDWTVVARRTRQKRSGGQGAVSEEKRTSKGGGRTLQIFVKVDGSKVPPLEMSPNDEVGDVPSSVRCGSRDVYGTSGGGVLRRSHELRSCRVVDGSTEFLSERLRGEAVLKSKKQNKQKKRQISEQLEKERHGQEHEVKGEGRGGTRRWTGYPATRAQREDGDGKREGGHHSTVSRVGIV